MPSYTFKRIIEQLKINLIELHGNSLLKKLNILKTLSNKIIIKNSRI
jgi:hypothetical protein